MNKKKQNKVAVEVAQPVDQAQLLKTGDQGLTEAEAQARAEAGLGNRDSQAASKKVSQIVWENVLIPFNLLNLILFCVILFVSLGDPRYLINGLFFGVAIINTASNIIQELKARRELMRLSLINQPRVQVVRSGQKREISVSDLVVGDLIELHYEDQVAVDAIYRRGINFLVDESLLTGESDGVAKKAGDQLLSGSYVLSGKCQAVVNKTGQATYAARLSQEAHKIKKPASEIKLALDQVSKTMGWIILFVGLAMLGSKFIIQGEKNYPAVLVSTVAALVGMMPEGLVLLNSMAFLVGVVRLAQNNILVQRMSTIETLARIDTLCLDKTGTITTGQIEMVGLHPCQSRELSPEERQLILAAMSGLDDQNSTSKAVIAYFSKEHLAQSGLGGQNLEITDYYSFNSDNKWSGVHFKDHGTWLFGAPERLLSADDYRRHQDYIAGQTSQGVRLLAVVRSADPSLSGPTGSSAALQDPSIADSTDPSVADLTGPSTAESPDSSVADLPGLLPDQGLDRTKLKPVCFLEMADQVRTNAKETFAYFKDQGVQLKIISGDSPRTVQAIAAKAGIEDLGRAIDLGDFAGKEDQIDYQDLAQNYQLFGRVGPFQKQKLIEALQKLGHVVGMTGDGVNDVPAFKVADCAVAMASGSDAAKLSADLVLLTDDLAEMIPTVYEGRRIINNVERATSLFLSKTTYMSVLAFVFVFLPQRFPLYPIQLTLIGSAVIGMPGFFLSLMPNHNRVSGSFLEKTMQVVLPAGLAASLTIVIHQFAMPAFGISLDYNSTISLILLLASSVRVLAKACRPFNLYTGAILMTSCLVLVLAFSFFTDFFVLETLPGRALTYTGGCLILGLVIAWLFDLAYHFLRRPKQRKTVS